MKITRYLFAAIMALTVVACTDGPEYAYQVDPAFEPYVQKFKDDAKRYGQNFDSTALIMRFAQLTDNKAGHCYMYRIPILIEIDQTYWDILATSSNVENLREELIFHEMGHGFMQRLHLNDQLYHGDWKSMMFGDALPNDREPTLNYRGMRKEYYIQELFTSTTTVPSWSLQDAPDFSDVQEQEMMRLNINEQCQLPLTNNNNIHSYIENNLLVVVNKTDTPMAIPLHATLPTATNFCVEIAYKTSGNDATSGGIIWGETDASHANYNMHYCDIYNNKHVEIGEYSCLLPFMDLYEEAVVANGFNKLTIRKHNNYLYYFINGKFVYYNDLDDLKVGGNTMGFLLSAKSTMHIESMVVKAPATVSNKSARLIPAIALPKQVKAYQK